MHARLVCTDRFGGGYMDAIARLVVLAVCLFSMVTVQAQSLCFRWKSASALGTFYGETGDELCESVRVAQLASDTAATTNPELYTITAIVRTDLSGYEAGAPTGVDQSADCVIQVTTVRKSDGVTVAQQDASRAAISEGTECEPHVPCEDLANKTFQVTASGVGDDFLPPGTGCFGSCEAFQQANNQHVRTGPSGARDWLLRYKWTGLECDAPPPPSAGPADSTAEKCAGSGYQLEFCAGPQSGDNCGYVNDTYTCLPKAQPDKCFVGVDGSMLCAEGAKLPPRPDNGTPGTPANPDDQLVTVGDTTTTYNFYNSTTVAGSSRPTPAGSNPDGTGVTPSQGGEDEEEGTGSATGGEGCSAPPSCSGDAILCASLKQQWLARCPAAVTDAEIGALLGPNDAIGSADTDLSAALSETRIVGSVGECPAAPSVTFPVYGTIELPFITWMCAYAVRLSPFVMMMAYMSAVLIIARGTGG